MNFLSDILLATGAFGAAVYCLILSRRLRALTTLDSGMGKAVAALSAQVDDLSHTLKAAQQTAHGAAEKLDTQNTRAEAACRQLELLMASLHDLPAPAAAPERETNVATEPPYAHPLYSWNRTAARHPLSVLATAPETAGSVARTPRVLRRRSAVGAA